MKVEILDGEALRVITPDALAAFAQSEGWAKAESYGKHADIFVGPDRPEIILPRISQLGDYASLVWHLIKDFSKVTDQDELATYRNLIEIDQDVVCISGCNVGDDGSIPHDVGMNMLAQSRNLLQAAACAVRVPHKVFHGHADHKVTDYMRRVKLGPTGYDSFMVALLTPAPLQQSASGQAVADELLEQCVPHRLMEALQALRIMANRALLNTNNVFGTIINTAVSTNLLLSLVELIEQSGGVAIHTAWARTRPVPQVSGKVVFIETDAEIFRQVIAWLETPYREARGREIGDEDWRREGEYSQDDSPATDSLVREGGIRDDLDRD